MRARTILTLLALLALPFAAGAATIQIPRTGQALCYDTAGQVIPCAGTGQDAETMKGVAWPVPRFHDNGNGTLTDLMTGLVWLRNANCYGHVSWQQALDNANALASGVCGLTDGSVAGDWRLPNRTELLSIASQNFSNGGDWLTSQGFVNALHDYYWTSDTCLDYGGVYKWIVHPVGAAYPDSWNLPGGSRVVMLVRSPQQVTVTAAVVGGHGVVASTNPIVVASGAAAAFALSPELGYQLNHTVTGTCQRGAFSGDVYDLGVATADCSVSFTFSPITHTITTSTSGSGSLACTPAGPVPYGVDATCTATPALGNHVAAVTIDGTDVSAPDPAGFSYTFAAMSTDHSVHAAFAIDSYTVLFRSGGNGTLTGSTSQAVERGTNTTPVTAVPATHYHFVNWTGDNGFAPTSVNPLTLNNVTTGRTITANFAPDNYLVTPGSAANGSIAPALPQTVSYNGVTSFTLNPATGYGVASASGCGGTLVGLTYTTAPVTGSCSVQFSFTPLTYTIATSTSGLGSLQCTPAGSVAYNGTVSCTAVPQAGNHIASVTVDGVSQAVPDPFSLTHAFSAVTANHTMRADFAINSYAVTFTSGSNGTLVGSTSQTVNDGGSCTPVSAAPATGYHFVNWTGDGGFIATSTNPLTITNVTKSQAVTANFAVDTHVVGVAGTANGTMTPSVPQTVNYNGVTSFSVTPATGYRVASVTGCSGTLNGATYTTAPVTADCNVAATFALLSYDIVGTASNDNGSITCTSPVNYGGSASCTLAPRPGYQLSAITDNGTDCLPLVADNGYTMSNVTAGHTVAAAFAANTYAIADAQKAYQALLGQQPLSANEKARYDVAPLAADGRPAPDGNVDVADVVLLLRKLVGVLNW